MYLCGDVLPSLAHSSVTWSCKWFYFKDLPHNLFWCFWSGVLSLFFQCLPELLDPQCCIHRQKVQLTNSSPHFSAHTCMNCFAVFSLCNPQIVKIMVLVKEVQTFRNSGFCECQKNCKLGLEHLTFCLWILPSAGGTPLIASDLTWYYYYYYYLSTAPKVVHHMLTLLWCYGSIIRH